MALYRPDWLVLLIGGSSGVGKTTVAEQVAVRFGVPWLMVDDLRLALQRSRVTLPERTEALYFFEETPNVRRLPPERRRDASIAVGEVMSPAVEVVVENHVDQTIPIVIEGDGILPSLLVRPPVRMRASRVASGPSSSSSRMRGRSWPICERASEGSPTGARKRSGWTRGRCGCMGNGWPGRRDAMPCRS